MLEKYRVALIKFNGTSRTYSYLCPDEAINVGDLVYVEGQDVVLSVYKIEYFTEQNAPFPITRMKHVLYKAVDNDVKPIIVQEEKNDSPQSTWESKPINDSVESNISTENKEKEDRDALKNFKGIKAIANVDIEFSYADYHTDCLMKVKDDTFTTPFSLVKLVALINHTENRYSNLSVKITFSNKAFRMNDIHIGQVEAYEESFLRIPFLKVDKLYLETLTEKETESVKFELIDNESNNILSCEEYNFMVMPISQPSKSVNVDSRLYAKYVTPLAPKVKQIALNAVKHNKGNSIVTYQNTGKNKYNVMLQEAQSIYLALHDWGIAYQNPPAGGLFTQRIRMPEEVLKDKKGTCLDLAILYCACLEEVGFNPILVLIDGHAFAGFFLEDKLGFPNSIEYQCGKVYNSATSGMNEIVLVECTAFTASNDISFQDAIKAGITHLKMYEGREFSAVDIKLAHKGIFSPIPNQGTDEDLELLIKPKEIKDKDLDSVVEVKYVDVLREEEKDRFTFWERKLLDLTESNPLVSFRLRTSNCLKMTSDSKIYQVLNRNDAVKFICPFQTNTVSAATIEHEFLKGDTKPSDLNLPDFDPEKMIAIGFEKTLKTLIKKSNSAMDETGAPTLYLCLGVLTYNKKRGNVKGHAPFMVLPIKISKDRLGPFYTISYDYDDIMINQTFFEYYKQEHPGVDFSELYQVSSSDNYMDIVRTFKANNTEDIQLDENSYFIANLTFAHYIMWQDMRKRKEELRKNKVIQSILENRNVLFETIDNLDKPIDELEQYHDFAAPLYYDSTQLKAILSCGEGKSFILDGPPGTGKSQTIVNMIVNAFYHGKTVLFVAEKKAALDVVADRLRKLGDSDSENNLGRFCLELHSNKANKSEFFEKLKKSMELGVTKNPEEFEQKCRELEEKRDRLLEVINKMHVRIYHYSLYDAIVRKEELEEYDYSFEFDEKYLLSLNDKKIKETYDLIDTYIANASNLNDFNNNPLKVLDVDNLNYLDKDLYSQEFNSTKVLLLDFINSYKEMVKNFDIEFNLEHDEIACVMDTLELSFNKKLYLETLTEFMSNKDDSHNAIIFEKSKAYLKLRNNAKDVFDFDSLLQVNAELAISELTNTKGFFSKLFTNSRWKKVLKNVLLPLHKMNKKELIEYFKQIHEHNSLIKYIKSNSSLLSKMIGFDFFSKVENVNEIEEIYFSTRRFLDNLNLLSNGKDFIKVSTLFMNFYATKNPSIKMLYTLNANKLQAYRDSESSLTSKYKIAYENYDGVADNLEKYITLLEYAANHSKELSDISNINKYSHALKELELGELLKAVIQNKIDFNDMKEVYDLSCVNGYIRLYFKDDDINYFNPSGFDAEVKKYKNLINEYNSLVIACVSARLTKNLNHSNINYANSSPIGRLKKSISSNGRGVSIRETLLSYDDIIKKYFPCFLMSPLSAAQYLAVDENGGRAVSKFDLVIFDEASQIPTHEAVGPIARGKSLIVAGDPEQMPPSAYFKAGLELAEDEIQYDDAVSLLDECISIELPRIRLAYHYRSKHESLISFSNHNFYNDNLYTFPSPNTANSLVEFNYVSLEEEKKNSKISKEEIDAICNKFKEIYSNPKTRLKSVGIIVFNMDQCEKVFDAITELLSKDKALNLAVEGATEKTKEPWFVKSLENVQGDERDIIILSVGFKKNAAGRATVSGPLSRENGQRRLNVAVSRSKEKMIIVSTIRYTDFDEDSKIKNKGQLLLKQFLKFAEENSFKASGGIDSNSGSIITFIKRDLEARGLKVVPNVGNSEFRVDLAIMNKTGDLYDLGILVDSHILGERISCRDKLYVQESVLNALKWKIINIYSIEYFKDKKGTIDKIIAAIDEPYIKEEYHVETHIEKAVLPDFHYDSIQYRKLTNGIRVFYDNDSGYDYRISTLLNQIISTESPVSFETIKIRVREHSNIQSMSAKAKSRLQSALRSFSTGATQDQNQMVYWAPGSNKDIVKFRTNSDRDLNDIPKEEIVAAMIQIINVQGKLSEEDLYRCTLEAFGYGQAVLSKKNLERLEYVYNWAKRYGKIM